MHTGPSRFTRLTATLLGSNGSSGQQNFTDMVNARRPLSAQKTPLIFNDVSKPWVVKQVKDVLNRKKQAFREKDKVRLQVVQKELKRELLWGREVYKEGRFTV